MLKLGSDNKWYCYYIAMGKTNVGDNSIVIDKVNIDDEDNVEIIVKENAIPISDIDATMTNTYPVCEIGFNKRPNSIIVKNTEGEKLKNINF